MGVLDKGTTAKDYYCDDEKKKRKARQIVEGYGITDDQIRAAAMKRFSKELLIFDRMKNYRASANRSSRREMDRRAGVRRPPSDQNNDRDWDGSVATEKQIAANRANAKRSTG